jgi:DNA-binding beta-propeller fold protein YncE
MRHTNGPSRMQQSFTAVLFLAALSVGLASTDAAAQTHTFIADTANNRVVVFNTGNSTAVKSIAVGTAPTQVVLSHDGMQAFVTNSGAPFSISVVDTSEVCITTNTCNDTITIPVAAAPVSVAARPTGDLAFVLISSGAVQVIDLAGTQTAAAPISVGGSDGGLAVTSDGAFLYVAAGDVSVFGIDVANKTLGVPVTFAPETTPQPDVFNFAVSVAIASDGNVYVGFNTYSYNGLFGFNASGGIARIKAGGTSVSDVVQLFSLPGSIAVSGDGRFVYAAINYMWFQTGYGAAFFPARTVAAVETAAIGDPTANPLFGWTDLGVSGDGLLWNQQHTPAGVAITPDGASVYVTIPAFNTIARIATADNSVDAAGSFALDGTGLPVPVPNGIAITPNPSAVHTPLTINAVDDASARPLPALAARPAVANVLANDTLGGAPAVTNNVTLTFVSATSAGVMLNGENGAVWTNGNAQVGPQSLVYKICETANADNCDTATVSLTVRAPYVIGAVNDHATSFAGTTPLANVVSNDTLNGGGAGPSNVTLSLLSVSDAGIGLNTADGSVFVTAGAAIGDHSLVYQICEIESPTNCANGTATVTVIPHAVQAVADSGTSPRMGGTPIANVLANDTFDGSPATLGQVTLTVLSSSNPGVTLNAATGAVSVASGTPAGPQTLQYRICEAASPSNCSDASVSITVNQNFILAVADRARASNKSASTPIANVLANDIFNGAPATTATVTLSLVPGTLTNSNIRLNLSTGAVDVLGKTSGGTVTFMYQICEPGTNNCSQATVTLDMSGK